VPGSDFDYHLLLFDEDGRERKEQDGSLHSKDVVEHETAGVTDVFLLSHGWKGDIPAAIRQYDRWVGAMLRQERDLQRMRSLVPRFKPLVVGVHWPSLPWGVEDVGAALLGAPEGADEVEDIDEFQTEEGLGVAALVDLYAPRIADTPRTRQALTTILTAAEQPENLEVAQTAARTGELPEDLKQAYHTLFEQAELQGEGAVGPPNADQGEFAPGATIKTWMRTDDQPAAQPAVLSWGGDLAERLKKAKETFLSPVRQVSFWTMKKRACTVGQSGVHQLVASLQEATTDELRVHLMGHSFGCIVVSAAVAGPPGGDVGSSALPRPVNAVFLVQGAMSLWSYAAQVSFADGQPGFFYELLQSGRIRGPLVTTQSIHDTAVGKYYPLGARVFDQVLLDGGLPKFGGIGSFGIQGAEARKFDDILATTGENRLQARDVANVDASRVICNGTGPSGAHSDISHDEVAHLMWQAAIGSRFG